MVISRNTLIRLILCSGLMVPVLAAAPNRDGISSAKQEDPKPIKVISCPPKYPPMSVLQDIRAGKAVFHLVVDSSGSVVKSSSVSGPSAMLRSFQDFVKGIKFGATQQECNGPWETNLEISLETSGAPGKLMAKVNTALHNTICTSTTHKCRFGP
jgi:hypothetical protein